MAVRELPPELQQSELGLIGRRRVLLIVGSVALPYEPSCPSAGRRSNVIISIERLHMYVCFSASLQDMSYFTLEVKPPSDTVCPSVDWSVDWLVCLS